MTINVENDRACVAAITEIDARLAELNASYQAQLKAIGEERANAIADLVAAERAYRSAHGLPERGAAAAVATLLGITPSRVYTILVRSNRNTT